MRLNRAATRAARCGRLTSLVRKSSAPEAQTRHRIQLAVPRRQKDDGQLGRQRAQIAAQIEAALGLILEGDIDDREIRQAGC